MRHNKDGRKFGFSGSHRKAMFRNMADSLIISGRVQTTLERAKEIRRLADRLVTLAKTGTLHAQRKALSILRTKSAFTKLFSEIGEKYKDRNGGYTRIIKVGTRKGDNAEMAYVEYVGNEDAKASAPKKRKRKRSSKPKTEEKAASKEA